MYALAEYPQHKQRIIDEIKANIKDLSSITYENLGVTLFLIRNFSLHLIS
jgi:hypothetical protein